jgi:hypothetical protein
METQYAWSQYKNGQSTILQRHNQNRIRSAICHLYACGTIRGDSFLSCACLTFPKTDKFQEFQIFAPLLKTKIDFTLPFHFIF